MSTAVKKCGKYTVVKCDLRLFIAETKEFKRCLSGVVDFVSIVLMTSCHPSDIFFQSVTSNFTSKVGDDYS